MDKAVAKLAAMGVPGLILLTAIGATGYAGGAAIVTALAAIGPGGIIGGIVTLGVIALVTEAIAEYGFDLVFSAVVKELYKKGETKNSIKESINRYPVSKNLKRKLIESLDNME